MTASPTAPGKHPDSAKAPVPLHQRGAWPASTCQRQPSPAPGQRQNGNTAFRQRQSTSAVFSQRRSASAIPRQARVPRSAESAARRRQMHQPPSTPALTRAKVPARRPASATAPAPTPRQQQRQLTNDSLPAPTRQDRLRAHRTTYKRNVVPAPFCKMPLPAPSYYHHPSAVLRRSSSANPCRRESTSALVPSGR